MQYTSSPSTKRSPTASGSATSTPAALGSTASDPTAPRPTVPVRVSLAAAVLLPLVVLAALHPGGPAAGALLVGFLVGRHR